MLGVDGNQSNGSGGSGVGGGTGVGGAAGAAGFGVGGAGGTGIGGGIGAGAGGEAGFGVGGALAGMAGMAGTGVGGGLGGAGTGGSAGTGVGGAIGGSGGIAGAGTGGAAGTGIGGGIGAGAGGAAGTGIGGGIGIGGIAGIGGSGGVSGGGSGGVSGSSGVSGGGSGGVSGASGSGGTTCTLLTETETAFFEGTFTNIDNKSRQLNLNDSSIFLARNWTAVWRAENGLPTAATPVWSLVGSIVPAIVTDSSETALRIDSLTGDLDQELYYTLVPSFSNATGWVVQWRARLAASDGNGSECSVDVIDSVWQVRMGLNSTQFVEVTTGTAYSFDPTQKMNTYRVEVVGTNFRGYVNENLQLTGAFNTTNTAPSELRFGDLFFTQDGDSFWNNVSWYTGSDHVPYLSSGEYVSRVFDLGTAANNLGNGAYLTVSASVPPTTSLSFETRSGATAVPDASWSTWAAVTEPGREINSPADQYAQVRAVLTTVDTAVTPVIDEITVNFCAD